MKARGGQRDRSGSNDKRGGNTANASNSGNRSSSSSSQVAWTGKNAANQLGIPVQNQGRSSGGGGGHHQQHHQRGDRRDRGGNRGNHGGSSGHGGGHGRHHGGPPPVADVKIPDEDFDFNKMFAKFKKEEFFEKETIEVVKYEKDDFFDSMSSDTNAPKERPDYRQQRRTDAETFVMRSRAPRRWRSPWY